MPNWVDNLLYINGPATTVLGFRNDCLSGDDPYPRIFENILPYEVTENMSSTEHIDAQTSGWGVKWGDIDTTIMQDWDLNTDTGCAALAYSFQTAWGVAEVAMDRLSLRYPQLKFSLAFIEEQPAFAGFTTWKGGSPLEFEYLDLEDAPRYDDYQDEQEYFDDWDHWYSDLWDMACFKAQREIDFGFPERTPAKKIIEAESFTL